MERMRQQFEVEAIQAFTRAAPDFGALDQQQQQQPGAPPPSQRPGPLQRSTTFASRRSAWAEKKVQQLFLAVHAQLYHAELLMLPAGTSVTQQTTVMLLAGELQCCPTMPEMGTGADATVDAIRWMCSAGRHQRQGLLPAAWEVLSDEDLAAAPGGALEETSQPLTRRERL